VARFRSMALRPIHRIKHVVDQQNALTIGTANFETLIETKDAPVLANTREVETGSKVNGIYLHIEIAASSSNALANVYMAVFKNPAGNLDAVVANAVGSSPEKKFVIHQEMVMIEQTANGNPRTLFNGVIVIPKGYRRFGPDDKLQVVLLSPGVTVNYCLQCHYKEFR